MVKMIRSLAKKAPLPGASVMTGTYHGLLGLLWGVSGSEREREREKECVCVCG